MVPRTRTVADTCTRGRAYPRGVLCVRACVNGCTWVDGLCGFYTGKGTGNRRMSTGASVMFEGMGSGAATSPSMADSPYAPRLSPKSPLYRTLDEMRADRAAPVTLPAWSINEQRRQVRQGWLDCSACRSLDQHWARSFVVVT